MSFAGINSESPKVAVVIPCYRVRQKIKSVIERIGLEVRQNNTIVRTLKNAAKMAFQAIFSILPKNKLGANVSTKLA